MRKITNLNDGWDFSKNIPAELDQQLDDGILVNLPHSWNAYDGQDGKNDYYRGQGWYTRVLPKKEFKNGERVWLEVNGANSVADLYINGQKADHHEGGYSTFRKDITDLLKKDDDNLITICVDNTIVPDVYPQMADFTFYGGLYRDVNLIEAPETHFDLDFYGAPGIMVASKINGNDADIVINAFVKNAQEGDRVEFEIYDEDGALVISGVRPAAENTEIVLPIRDVHKWQGVEDPYLYSVVAKLIRHNEELDEVSANLGVREFYIDPEKGFFLNGKSMPLRGVSRHQDKLDLGNALSYEDMLEDIMLIREMGANTIRLAHYQHDQAFYDLCDQFGMIVWAEIPFISIMSDDPKAVDNTMEQMRELIYQNYNHPSIIVWGISNEITIGGEKEGLMDNLTKLNDLAHELDKTRLTTMAQVSMLPMESEQNQLTDVLSYNHYFGWYTGKFEDNEKWFDEFHKKYPDRPVGISEYGCEGITSYHNDEPKAGDYSEEYQSRYHEHMARMISERPYLWATHIWNMFDFGCDARDEGGVAGRNNKGMMTLDRKVKKDPFYLYQAYWTDEPMIHITSKRYAQRTGDSIEIRVYTNAKGNVTLKADGKVIAEKPAEKVTVFENVPLHDGFNTYTVEADGVTDTAVFEKVDEPNPGYTFVSTEQQGVSNWFDDKDLSEVGEETFDPAYYSTRDQMKDILASEEATQVLLNGLASLTGMRINSGMMQMMGENRLSDMMNFVDPEKLTVDAKQALKFINQELQKIKK